MDNQTHCYMFSSRDFMLFAFGERRDLSLGMYFDEATTDVRCRLTQKDNMWKSQNFDHREVVLQNTFADMFELCTI